MLELSKIRIDGGTQSRVELNQGVVDEYAVLYREGVQMPPVKVFFDGSTFWLADGFHRFFGAKQAGRENIHEERILGTQREAVLFSLGANAKHGLRRSNADKRKAVQTLLDDPEWAAWSSREVAKQCGVSHTFVDGVRESSLATLPVTTPADRTYATKHGTTATMVTGNIGRQPASNSPRVDPLPLPAKATPTTVSVAHVGSAPAINDAPSPAASSEPVQSELEELKDFCKDQGQNLKATLAENESMAKVFDAIADDKLSSAMAEVKRLTALNTALESRNEGLMNEKKELLKFLNNWKRRAEKAEKALREVRHAI